MIWVKIYRTPQDVLLAAADEDIIGKEFRQGKFKIKVSEHFYKDMLVTEEQYIELFSTCSVANIVGKNAVSKAIEKGYISSSNVLIIDGVPHAQFSILEE